MFCSISLNLRREHSPVCFTVHPPTTISSRIINKCQCFHRIHHGWQMMWYTSYQDPFFCSFSILSSSNHSGPSSSWCHLPKKYFQKCSSSNRAFLFLSVASGLHIVVNLLYFHVWRRLSIGHLYNDTPTSLRVLNVRFLNPGNRSTILYSMCLLWPFRSFYAAKLASVFFFFF